MSGRPAAKKLATRRDLRIVSSTMSAARTLGATWPVDMISIELGERLDLLATRGRIHQQLRERFRFQLEMSQKTNYRCNRFL